MELQAGSEEIAEDQIIGYVSGARRVDGRGEASKSSSVAQIRSESGELVTMIDRRKRDEYAEETLICMQRLVYDLQRLAGVPPEMAIT